VLPRNIDAFLLRVERGFSGKSFAELGRTFVGGFNWYSRDMPATAYVVAALLGALALVSSLLALRYPPRGISRPILSLAILVFVFQIVLVVLRGVGQGRYLMPVLPALAMIAVVGLVAPFSAYRRPVVTSAFAFLMVVYDALFLWGGLVPNEYLLWGS